MGQAKPRQKWRRTIAQDYGYGRGKNSSPNPKKPTGFVEDFDSLDFPLDAKPKSNRKTDRRSTLYGSY